MDKVNASLQALRWGFVRIGQHLRRSGAAYGVLLIALLLTVLAWHYVRQNVEAQTRARFDETTQATQEAIERRTKAYLDAMFGARGLFYASRSVTREEWANYVEGIEPNRRFEGLQALSYAQRVDPEQREAFSRRAQKEGLPSLHPDLVPGGERRVYFPITYIGPLDAANQERLHYDFYADPVHREASDLARDTAKPQATKMVNVLTEAPEGHSADLALRSGFVVYLPIYQEGEPLGSVAERRRALQGFIIGRFISDELLDGIFRGSFDPAIDFEVYDGKNIATSPLLYDRDGILRAREENEENTASSPLLYDRAGVSRAREEGEDTLFSKETRTEVAGREWSLYFATLPAFEEEAESNLPAFVLASGVGVSLLLFGITWMLVRSRTRAERATRELEEANRGLEEANKELESFSYSVSHDLRAPLRSIEGFSQIVLEDHAEKLDEEGRDYLGRVRAASRRMALLIDDLLELSRVTRTGMRKGSVNLSALAKEVALELEKSQPKREATFVIAEGLVASGDARLLKLALENLLGNAFKFTSKEEKATIEFGAIAQGKQEEGGDGGGVAYYVRDNGVGFEERYAAKLFGPFQRLHGAEEFEGTGIGLATVARIVRRHGGRVWATGEVGEGATFFFTLGDGHRQGPSPPSKK